MNVKRIMTKEFFLNVLNLELKRARRYQNFFSILKFKLLTLPGSENDNQVETCFKTLSEVLAEELRESDILSFLGDDQWAVLIPYADLATVDLLKSRIMDSLEYCGFKKKGYEVTADLICFPVNGTTEGQLMGKLCG